MGDDATSSLLASDSTALQHMGLHVIGIVEATNGYVVLLHRLSQIFDLGFTPLVIRTALELQASEFGKFQGLDEFRLEDLVEQIAETGDRPNCDEAAALEGCHLFLGLIFLDGIDARIEDFQ
jgi:hypothetical protein